jgi:hypothetical protein
MFDLERAIRKWRGQVAAGGITPPTLDELESHLREEVDQQVGSGADAQQAFETAIQRMGAPRELRREFAKLENARQNPRRFLRRAYVVSAVLVVLIQVGTMAALDWRPWERAALAGASGLVAAYLAVMPFLPRWLSAAGLRRALVFIKVVTNVAALWPIVAILAVHKGLHLEIGDVPVMIIWSLYAGILIGALAWAFYGDEQGRGGAGGLLPPFDAGPIAIPPVRPTPPNLDFSAAKRPAFTAVAGPDRNAGKWPPTPGW